MKYLSVILFAVMMIWTWSVIHDGSSVPFETHVAIQDKLAVILADTIRAKKPQISDVIIDQIWTEFLGKGKVRAHFSYRYKEATSESGATESHITGTGNLERLVDDGSGADRWKLFNVKTTQDSVIFEEPLIISTSEASTSKDEDAKDSKSPNE